MDKNNREMTERFKESLNFVTRMYRPDAFRPTRRFTVSGWRRPAVAASIAGGILVAAACFFAVYNPSDSRERVPAPQPVQTEQTQDPALVVKRIEFNDAPLSQVVAEIERVYGVEVSILNEEDKSLRLTLSYEGTPTDLIETINELLGTDLEITGTSESTSSLQ